MMKNKNLLIGLCSVPLLLSISTNMIAQALPFCKRQDTAFIKKSN